MDSNELAWAAFRTALISPLLTGEISSGQREAYMQSVAAEERLFPNGKRATVLVARSCVGVSTFGWDIKNRYHWFHESAPMRVGSG